MTLTKAMSGGCQCGAVRYEFTGTPLSATFCHCRMCQKAGGNLGLPLVSLEAAKLVWTRGHPSEFRSSPLVARGFCAQCGTPLYMREVGDACYEITIGSLDSPQSIAPTAQVGIESRLSWFQCLSALPEKRTDQDRTVHELAKLNSLQHPDLA